MYNYIITKLVINEDWELNQNGFKILNWKEQNFKLIHGTYDHMAAYRALIYEK